LKNIWQALDSHFPPTSHAWTRSHERKVAHGLSSSIHLSHPVTGAGRPSRNLNELLHADHPKDVDEKIIVCHGEIPVLTKKTRFNHSQSFDGALEGIATIVGVGLSEKSPQVHIQHRHEIFHLGPQQ